jgi:alpha-beta hydrolase superfamily lysophospholipase
MAILTQTHLLIHPPGNANYTVQHIDIPVTDLAPAGKNFADGSRWKVDGLGDPTRAGRPAPRAAMPASIFHPVNPTGAWVMLVCGAGDNRFAFKWILTRELMKRGITLLTVDPPGHGDFMSVPATASNVRAGMLAAAAWLHNRSDVKRIGVLGISFGGCQVAWLASEDDRIDAIATISAPIQLPHVSRTTVALEASRLVLPRNVLLLRHASWPQIWAEWKSMRGAWFGEDLYAMIESFDMLTTVRKIGSRPTAFVHGSADVAVPPATARRLYDAATPKKDLIYVPQASHITVVLHDDKMTELANWFDAHLNR